MEIRHLQTFIAIVELGGFTKAADNLGYAQSTITAHIQILESEIGANLFDRLGKKIVLTSIGKKLVPYANQMLNIYKDIKNITDEQNEVSGDLIIGAGESLTIYRLGEILKEYKAAYPKVNIILKNSICSDLRNRLHSGEFDVVFTIEPQVDDKDFVVKKLKDECMVIIGAQNTDLEFYKADCKNQPSKENIIFSEKGCSFRKAFENYLEEKNIKYKNPLEFTSMEAIKKYVIDGLGISIVPLYVVKEEVMNGKLKGIEVEKPFPKCISQLIYHKNKKISAPMDKLIEIAIKKCMSWN